MDLNQLPNSPLRKIPVYDQVGSELCYSYSSVQMIDYFRFKNGDKTYDLTNPVFASWVTYYKNPLFIKRSSLRSGSQEDVVEALKKHGVCSNSETKQKMKGMIQLSGGMSEAEVLQFLEIIYKHYNGLFASKDWGKVSKEASQCLGMSCQNQNNFREALEKTGLLGVAPTKILEDIFKGCKMKKVVVPALDKFEYGNDHDMEVPIQKALKSDFPAAVDICANFLETPAYRGLLPTNFPTVRIGPKGANLDCAKHAALIVGQAKINGSCNYLIRNSRGASWRPRAASACACITHDGKYKQNCQHEEAAEFVGCWYKKEDVIANTGAVNVFK